MNSKRVRCLSSSLDLGEDVYVFSGKPCHQQLKFDNLLIGMKLKLMVGTEMISL